MWMRATQASRGSQTASDQTASSALSAQRALLPEILDEPADISPSPVFATAHQPDQSPLIGIDVFAVCEPRPA